MRVLAALIAMLAQIFFSTAHMAAMAATIAGPLTLAGAPEGSLGLLQICTANGLLTVNADGNDSDSTRHSNNPTEQCPVCVSAAMGDFSLASDVPVAIEVSASVFMPLAPPAVLRPGLYHAALSIRAPPRG
ncbi:MAG: hypothetical protein C0605_03325 [Hyphomicrobiales bacterium]|nr:MAG: hypothetical protein C0605_03325 [Hyphomicrobiales bacterium]